MSAFIYDDSSAIVFCGRYWKGYPLLVLLTSVHLWKDAEERKNARRHKDFGHSETRILCLLAQNSDTVVLALYHSRKH